MEVQNLPLYSILAWLDFSALRDVHLFIMLHITYRALSVAFQGTLEGCWEGSMQKCNCQANLTCKIQFPEPMQSGKRKVTPRSCPITYTCTWVLAYGQAMHFTYTHTHTPVTINKKSNFNE